MSLLTWSVLTLLLAVGVYLYTALSAHPPRPEISLAGWFGRGAHRRPDNPEVRQFRVDVPDTVLADLKQRLARAARLGEDLENNENFHYGMNAATMRNITVHWREKYEWRKHEAELNKFPQFVTQIEGIDLHFIRVKPSKQEGTPRVLLMTHGWPGSVWEFYKILPVLTEPEKHGGRQSDAFEVIWPSIPGYGFSEIPHQKGMDVTSISRIFVKLMTRLGHERFFIQGGDWGGFISQQMAAMYPSVIEGVHLNMYAPPGSSTGALAQLLTFTFPSLYYSEFEYKSLAPISDLLVRMLRETGYFHIQATKPDTVGIALNDSPVALGAYILEKFAFWTRHDSLDKPDGGLTEYYTMDELLTNVMIYWVTGTITSSSRLYREHFTESVVDHEWDKQPVSVPAGLAAFPDEIAVCPQFLARLRFQDIVHVTEMPRGGHFAAFEQPALLANDIQNFVRKVRSKTSNAT